MKLKNTCLLLSSISIAGILCQKTNFELIFIVRFSRLNVNVSVLHSDDYMNEGQICIVM